MAASRKALRSLQSSVLATETGVLLIAIACFVLLNGFCKVTPGKCLSSEMECIHVPFRVTVTATKAPSISCQGVAIWSHLIRIGPGQKTKSTRPS